MLGKWPPTLPRWSKSKASAWHNNLSSRLWRLPLLNGQIKKHCWRVRYRPVLTLHNFFARWLHTSVFGAVTSGSADDGSSCMYPPTPTHPPPLAFSRLSKIAFWESLAPLIKSHNLLVKAEVLSACREPSWGYNCETVLVLLKCLQSRWSRRPAR